MTESYWMQTHSDFLWKKSKSVQRMKHLAEVDNVTWDFVIVGAGIAGISTAFWLNQIDSQLKVLIVDKAKVLEGATARNAGFVTCGSIEHFRKLERQFGTDQALKFWRFSEENRRLMEEQIFLKDPNDFEVTERGACTVASSEEAASLYFEEGKRLQSLGLDVEFLSRSEMNERLGVRGFEAGLMYAHDRGIHPLKAMDAMLAKTNVSILEDTLVLEVNESPGNSTKILTNSGVIVAKQVVLASSYQISEICKTRGINLIPQRSQVIVTKSFPIKTHALCYHTKYLCYFRQMNNGRYLIGGFRNLDLNAEQTKVDNVTEKIQFALENFFVEELSNDSALKDFVEYRWSGVMGFTSDGQMLLGRVPGASEIYLIGGCNSHGMGLFFHAAKVLAESFNGGEIPIPYNPSRFQTC